MTEKTTLPVEAIRAVAILVAEKALAVAAILAVVVLPEVVGVLAAVILPEAVAAILAVGGLPEVVVLLEAVVAILAVAPLVFKVPLLTMREKRIIHTYTYTQKMKQTRLWIVVNGWADTSLDLVI